MTEMQMPVPGTFSWNELTTNDVEACKTFFTQLMGWTTESVEMPQGGNYTIFMQGETRVGGLMQMTGPESEGMPPTWTGYLTVEDVDATCEKCTSLGGKIMMGPMSVEGIGRFALIADPTGAVVGLATYVPCD